MPQLKLNLKLLRNAFRILTVRGIILRKIVISVCRPIKKECSSWESSSKILKWSQKNCFQLTINNHTLKLVKKWIQYFSQPINSNLLIWSISGRLNTIQLNKKRRNHILHLLRYYSVLLCQPVDTVIWFTLEENKKNERQIKIIKRAIQNKMFALPPFWQRQIAM